MKKKSIIVISLILLLLLLDQIFKIWVKTNMCLGCEKHLLGEWFKLHFIENEGMAFGMVFFGGYWGKLLLTFFRIIASAAIGWIVYKAVKLKVHWGVLICIALIFTGAVGNIIDCVFYGKIFSESTFLEPAATLFPECGYAPFFQGKVVDMLQFDLFSIPQWVPFFGGLSFFPAIFNLADSYITVGLFTLILFFWKPLSAFINLLEKKPKIEA